MDDPQVHYLPLTPGFFSILVFLALALVILIQLRILRYAYMRLGVSPGVALLLLFGSLIGSYFNLPITVLPGPPVRSGQIVDFFGMRYVVPFVVSPSTILAVNVGGAVIPTLMSAYLVLRYQLWLRAAIAVAAIGWYWHCRAGLCAGRGHGNPCPRPLPRICSAAGLYRRIHGNANRRRYSQSGQDRQPWRAHRLHRWRRDI